MRKQLDRNASVVDVKSAARLDLNESASLSDDLEKTEDQTAEPRSAIEKKNKKILLAKSERGPKLGVNQS